MTGMAAEKALDPKVVVSLVQERNGEYPFSDLIQALQEKGFDESKSRELIWHTLALGEIEFTPDRSAVRILTDTKVNNGDKGKVA